MKNITIKQYATLADTTKYDAILKHLKPKNYFCKNKAKIGDNTYSEVMHCYKLIKKIDNWEKMFELYEICYKVSETDFWNETIVNFWHSLNYLIETFKAMQQKENELLSGSNVNHSLWERAGGNTLKTFSVISPLDDLGQRYGMYPFDLMEKKYNQILILLSLTKRKDAVLAKYSELKAKQK